MKKHLPLLLLLLLLIGLTVVIFSRFNAKEEAKQENLEITNNLSPQALPDLAAIEEEGEGRGLYKQYCAGCHGSQLEGNSAPGLIKHQWKYGSANYLMGRNIRFGIPNTEMGPFQELLNDEQIQSLVKYIKDAQLNPPTLEKKLPPILKNRDYELQLEIIADEGLEVPWAIEFIDPTSILLSERKGQLRLIKEGKLLPTAVSNTPLPHTGSSTGGYMDIALHPDFDKNQWIYLGYSHTDGDPKGREERVTTKIIRGKIKDNTWVEQETIFEAPKNLWVEGGNRWGCRLLFNEENQLFFTIGDMAQAQDSQDPTKVCGKVFRVNDDGSIPEDNPYYGQVDKVQAIYTLGNRNVQGLAFHPMTGALWSSDHGPMGGMN